MMRIIAMPLLLPRRRMFQTIWPKPAVSRLALVAHESHSGILYIGLGDQFDDDRRAVRETAPVPRPAAQRGRS